MISDLDSDNACVSGPQLWAIVAMGSGGEIGRDGDMPWHLPEDLKHFKQTTMGHPIIMGRATWESLPRRPLPGRLNIVLSRNSQYVAEGASVVSSVGEALNLCRDLPVPFIIGGGAIYKAAMPMTSRIFVTRIEADYPDADTFFPDFSHMRCVEATEQQTSASGLKYHFETYEIPDNQ